MESIIYIIKAPHEQIIEPREGAFWRLYANDMGISAHINMSIFESQ